MGGWGIVGGEVGLCWKRLSEEWCGSQEAISSLWKDVLKRILVLVC